jgi:hypothetical protein
MTDAVSRQAMIEAVDAAQFRNGTAIERLHYALQAINALPSLESVDALVKAARDYLDCTNTGSFEEQCQSESVLKVALSAFDKE